jgi:hypothetical protein
MNRGFPHTVVMERGVTLAVSGRKYVVVLASIDGRIVVQHLCDACADFGFADCMFT